MKRYKTFAAALVGLLTLYCLFNLVVWKLYTERLLNDGGGDLTRLGYLADCKMPRQPYCDLPRRHIERAEHRQGQVDVITIGDSFSHGGGAGRNCYYQDYIASWNGLSVLNLPEYKQVDKITTISILNNNGYLDRIKPRYILIESAEKKAFVDLPDRFDFDRTMTEQELERLPVWDYTGAPGKRGIINLDFFTQANYKFVRNNLLYRFSDNACGSSPVIKAKLTRPLFSIKNDRTLLFHNGDVKGRSKFTPANNAKLNDALNTLADRLAQKGIRLYYMPCVDKYNAYSGYIANNKYPRSTFFEQLRPLPKRYVFIDTKALVEEELQRGEKDVFYPDDTHWSWKAAEKVFSRVRFGDGAPVAATASAPPRQLAAEGGKGATLDHQR
jgi:hypothetical protein